MAEIDDLDIVDANNTARFPEGQAPSWVHDGARVAFDGDTPLVTPAMRSSFSWTEASGLSAASSIQTRTSCRSRADLDRP